MVEHKLDEATVSGFQSPRVQFHFLWWEKSPLWGFVSLSELLFSLFVHVVLLNKSYYLKVKVAFSLFLAIHFLLFLYLWASPLITFLLPPSAFICSRWEFIEGLIGACLCLWHRGYSSEARIPAGNLMRDPHPHQAIAIQCAKCQAMYPKALE